MNEFAKQLLNAGVTAGVANESEVLELAQKLETASCGVIIADGITGIGTALQILEAGGCEKYANDFWAKKQQEFAQLTKKLEKWAQADHENMMRPNRQDYEILVWIDKILEVQP